MFDLIQLEAWEKEKNRGALQANDICCYFMHYNSLADLKIDQSKQLIKNLKITPEELLKTPTRRFFKEESINEAAKWLIGALNKHKKLLEYTWISAFSSKTKADKNFDDRLVQILKIVQVQLPSFKWCEIFDLKQSVETSRQGNNRNYIEKINNLLVNEDLLTTIEPKKIVFFDDILTTGSTFKAAKEALRKIDPSIQVIGVFIAKAVRNTDASN